MLHVYSGTVQLNGLTISDGDANYGGGLTVGTYCGCNTADVTVTNSVIRNNMPITAPASTSISAARCGWSIRPCATTTPTSAAAASINAGTLTVINSTL